MSGIETSEIAAMFGRTLLARKISIVSKAATSEALVAV
jgi:hypothetical protein